VQALIIDGVLPEIADEANLLLSQMTGGRMSLTMTTQRETQKKAVVETLDIKVSDELGDTRSYEMFSGGEAFRINFALRIALSRLLARRAGAPLPTLIIDEGFGTQDSGGRERLVEAIQAIQDDFRCLLVIHPRGRAAGRLPGADRGHEDARRLDDNGGVGRLRARTQNRRPPKQRTQGPPDTRGPGF